MAKAAAALYAVHDQLELGTIVERVELQRRARRKGDMELGGHNFQAWIERWRQRHLDGEDVTVLVARDGSHAVAIWRRRG